MSRARLLVSGDDFGAAPEVNAGIIRAHQDGILTGASLMVTGGAVEEAVALAKDNPRLAVGLHLVLAQGRPASRADTVPDLLRPDGRFGDQPIVNALDYAATWLRDAGRAQLEREIEAQLAAFRDTGLQLSHVDGHCNMHLHPMILPMLLARAPRYGIRAIRLTRDPLLPALGWDASHALRKVLEGVVFRALAAWAEPRIHAAGLVTTERVVGIHQTGSVDEAYLISLLETLPAGVTELYCHPAIATAPEMAPHQPGYRNRDELEALTSPAVRAALQRSGAELISYRELAA